VEQVEELLARIRERLGEDERLQLILIVILA